jgi:hypothetical protein
MPTLLTFGEFRLRLYFGDHGIPHFHLIGRECAAVIAIETGELIVGDAPANALETARKFIETRRETLLEMWRK